MHSSLHQFCLAESEKAFVVVDWNSSVPGLGCKGNPYCYENDHSVATAIARKLKLFNPQANLTVEKIR